MTPQENPSLVRIEVGTSELEGGACRAWTEPSLVLGVVALGHPEDTFARFIEPRLRELSSEEWSDGETSPETAGELPAPLRRVVASLQAVHAKLYKENRSLLREARWVEMACAAAEEDRIWFVKTAPTWICLLRDGQAHLAEGLPEASVRTGLGSSERLRLEVTSIPIQPGDIIVIASSELAPSPDLRAVARLFAQTPDMKRACDGLVNLLGLQSPAASAVAFKFIPVGANQGEGERENPIKELSLLLDRPAPAPSTASDAATTDAGSVVEQMFAHAPERPVVPREPAIDFGTEVEDWQFPWESAQPTPEPSPQPKPTLPTPQSTPPTFVSAPIKSPVSHPGGTEPVEQTVTSAEAAAIEELMATPAVAPAATDADDTGTPGRFGRRDEVNSSMRRPAMIAMTVVLILVGAGLLALAAIPSLRQGVGKGFVSPLPNFGTGALVIEPSPPAVGIEIDGVTQTGGSPFRLESISAGLHRVRVDLGAAGIHESEVRVVRGEPTRWAPRLPGRVEVVGGDPSRQGRVWIQGRAPIALPASLDSIPLGWARLFYEDSETPLWDRPIFVRADHATRVLVPNHRFGVDPVVEVESWSLADGRGLVASHTDSVFIDGQFTGLTPLEQVLLPGLRSVGVRSADGGQYVELIEAREHSARTVVARFGTGDRPSLVHHSPGRIVVRGPVPIMLTVEGSLAAQTAPKLHLPELATGRLDIPLEPIDLEAGTFGGLIPDASIPLAGAVTYYFTASAPDGDLVYSDLFRLEPRRNLATATATPPKPDSTPTRSPAIDWSAMTPSGEEPVAEP